MIGKKHKTYLRRFLLLGLFLAVLAGCATGGADVRLLDEAEITPPGAPSGETATSSLRDVQLRRVAEQLGLVLHVRF